MFNGSGGGGARSITSYTTSIVTLEESLTCIYVWSAVSDLCTDAVCHIVELRPEARQLSRRVHNLDKNPVYTAQEVYFVSPFPPCPAVYLIVKYFLRRSVRRDGPTFPSKHLQLGNS